MFKRELTKEKAEKSTVLFVLGLLFTGFLSGIGTYEFLSRFKADNELVNAISCKELSVSDIYKLKDFNDIDWIFSRDNGEIIWNHFQFRSDNKIGLYNAAPETTWKYDEQKKTILLLGENGNPTTTFNTAKCIYKLVGDINVDGATFRHILTSRTQ